MTALVPDFARFPVDAEERRDAFLVCEADAVVVVWDGRDAGVQRVFRLAERRGVPLQVMGGEQKAARVVRVPDPVEPDTRRGLPG